MVWTYWRIDHPLIYWNCHHSIRSPNITLKIPHRARTSVLNKEFTNLLQSSSSSKWVVHCELYCVREIRLCGWQYSRSCRDCKLIMIIWLIFQWISFWEVPAAFWFLSVLNSAFLSITCWYQHSIWLLLEFLNVWRNYFNFLRHFLCAKNFAFEKKKYQIIITYLIPLIPFLVIYSDLSYGISYLKCQYFPINSPD